MPLFSHIKKNLHIKKKNGFLMTWPIFLSLYPSFVAIQPGQTPYREVFSRQGTPEPGPEKTCLQGFPPGPTQTGLYSHRRLLEVRNLGLRKWRDCITYEEKTKGADKLHS